MGGGGRGFQTEEEGHVMRVLRWVKRVALGLLSLSEWAHSTGNTACRLKPDCGRPGWDMLETFSEARYVWVCFCVPHEGSMEREGSREEG